jgi:xanthosine utilization system XapX-like protein
MQGTSMSRGRDNFALLLPLQVKIPAPPRLGGFTLIGALIKEVSVPHM